MIFDLAGDFLSECAQFSVFSVFLLVAECLPDMEM